MNTLKNQILDLFTTEIIDGNNITSIKGLPELVVYHQCQDSSKYTNQDLVSIPGHFASGYYLRDYSGLRDLLINLIDFSESEDEKSKLINKLFEAFRKSSEYNTGLQKDIIKAQETFQVFQKYLDYLKAENALIKADNSELRSKLDSLIKKKS